MTTYSLQAFKAVYENKSIAKAAEQQHITPQGLGKTLRNLEKELGVPLFERYSTGSVPTAYAHLLYEKANRIIELLDEIRDGVKGNTEKEKIIVNVPITSGLMDYFPQQFVENFEQKYNVKLNIFQTHDYGIEQFLLKGESNIGIVGGPVDTTKFHVKKFLSIRHVLVLNDHDALSDKETIAYQDLDGRRIALISRMDNQYHAMMYRFEKANAYPEVGLEAAQMGSVKKYASDNLGIGISTELHAKFIPFPNTVIRYFEDPGCTWDTFLVYPVGAKLSRYERQFCEYALNWVKNN